jgi:PEP-CTERM motif
LPNKGYSCKYYRIGRLNLKRYDNFNQPNSKARRKQLPELNPIHPHTPTKTMKTTTLVLAIGTLLASPVIGHAANVYTDTFDTDTAGAGNAPAGWTVYGYGLQYQGGHYISPTDDITIGNGAATTTGTAFAYVGITPIQGTLAVFLGSQGIGPSTPDNTPGTQGLPDQMDLLNSNVGATFAANTTYTLSYEYGSQLEVLSYTPYTLNPFGTISVSLEGNGTDIAASTQTVTTPADGAFYQGTSVVIDTALDPALVGQNIGIDAGFLNTSGTLREVGFDDFSLAAAADAGAAVPEPSSLALTGFGVAGLLMMLRRKAAQL